MSLLELRLAKLNKKMDNESNDINIKLISKDIERTENLIQDEQESKTQAIIFRSKCKWYLLGERNTKYYLNLEKKDITLRILLNYMINAATYTLILKIFYVNRLDTSRNYILPPPKLSFLMLILMIPRSMWLINWWWIDHCL